MPSVFNPKTDLKGLALPARQGSNGPFETKGPNDVAWGDLLMALFVPRGSRPMNRQFGSTLYNLLFDPIVIEDEIVRGSVKDIAAQFCPHIVIRSVKLDNPDPTRVTIAIVFSLASDLAQTSERNVIVTKTDLSIVGVN